MSPKHRAAREPAPVAHPQPSAKALHERRMNERLRLACQDTPVRNCTMREPYTGAELAASVRPGAMDAYALPSVEMGRRVHTRGSQR